MNVLILYDPSNLTYEAFYNIIKDLKDITFIDLNNNSYFERLSLPFLIDWKKAEAVLMIAASGGMIDSYWDKTQYLIPTIIQGDESEMILKQKLGFLALKAKAYNCTLPTEEELNSILFADKGELNYIIFLSQIKFKEMETRENILTYCESFLPMIATAINRELTREEKIIFSTYMLISQESNNYYDMAMAEEALAIDYSSLGEAAKFFWNAIYYSWIIKLDVEAFDETTAAKFLSWDTIAQSALEFYRQMQTDRDNYLIGAGLQEIKE